MYITPRFLIALLGLSILFILGSYSQTLYYIALGGTALLAILSSIDLVLLYRFRNPLEATRQFSKKLSLGDEQQVTLTLNNKTKSSFYLELIDELPDVFQVRDFSRSTLIKSLEHLVIKYPITPLQRGKHIFHHLNVFVMNHPSLYLFQRKLVFEKTYQPALVYPSIIQMRYWELMLMKNAHAFNNSRKVRKLGMSYEFEQVREYVVGDDIRHINWKNTSRRNKLVINQYNEERSQNVYSIIDKGRSMAIPFYGYSLLDYAINTSLVISNVVLNKGDKAGLITFSNGIRTSIKADNKPFQITNIMNALYDEKQYEYEANYEILYQSVKKIVKTRSIVLFYTNFESIKAMERVLPLLRKINQEHHLVVIYFSNDELNDFAEQQVENLYDIYRQSLTQKMLLDKVQIGKTLQSYGIDTLYTSPKDLSFNTINKYLEIKNRAIA